MNPIMNKQPIFIHSLFRAGSTYLFQVFRRASGCWSYQEPLHEIAYFSRHRPTLLNVDHGESKTVLLRHPKLEEGYFRELLDVWPSWRETITPGAIYNSYFNPPLADIGIAYWQSLIDASKGRPVFQECRTSGRIGAIKAALGGYHIYLWRNPWDQWWSYKVTPYFDTANQLIIRAPNAPGPVILLRKELGLQDDMPEDLFEALAHYSRRPLTSEQSYLIFYLLWCLGLREGLAHADTLLNIDRLSDSSVYREEIQVALQQAGIPDIDFSDCRVPQGLYLEQDRAFFEPLEDRVHQWLLAGGWAPQQIEQLQTLRLEFTPAVWALALSECSPEDLAEQAHRGRALSRRLETDLAQKVITLTETTQQAEAREAQAREDARRAMEVAQQAQVAMAQAESRAQQAEAQAEQDRKITTRVESEIAELKRNLAAVRSELQDVHQSNHYHWQLAEQRGSEIAALRASLSWRITAPLRSAAAPVVRYMGVAPSKLIEVSSNRAIRWAMGQPKLVAFVHRCVRPFPRIRQAITDRVAISFRHPIGPASVEITPPPNNLAQFSPRARQIYAQLTSAIEKRQKEVS